MFKFLRAMFRTAGEVASLTRECLFLQKEREHLQWKVEALEKEVRQERKRFDTFQKTYFNQISVKHGLYGAFTEEVKSDAPKLLPPVLTAFQEQELAAYAQEMRSGDIDAGMENIPPLETYIERMREDADRYLQH